jgi:TolB-like protein/predicted negative regulator of RcsB-dependent stress response
MPHNNNFCYEFGPYSLEPAQRLLRRDGDPVSLTPKATEILLILLKNAGQLVEKEELIREIWPNTFVEEANITQNIFTLRRALGDAGTGPKYIETVSRRGYRFVAPVRKVAAAQHLSVDLNSEESERKTVSAQSPTKPPIIAVLPFLNTTGDIKVEYFADGITESIINSLSRISKLRVMSRSSVFRYKGKDLDPQNIGQELGVEAVLVGKVHVRESGLLISAELVDVANGWQLWGESFDRESSDIFEIQDEIARQLSATLRVRLTGDEERRITKRYTENAEAYQAYLEGRYHWSKYTRASIEKGIVHFRRAIDVDPNYALAYAGIVDCYLRLATNYLPPEDLSLSGGEAVDPPVSHDERSDTEASDEKIRLRHEWDWKGAERELRRANELKSNYPAAHQWHAAYQFSVELYKNSAAISTTLVSLKGEERLTSGFAVRHTPALNLTPDEEVQVFCTIAREQIEVGNYEAGCLVLQRWWTLGEWPKLEGLSPHSAADLLFTVGALASWISSTGHIQTGQKHAEALLNGSIALFEHLGSKRRSAEGQIELAMSYYRQGMFDLARTTLVRAFGELSEDDRELRSVGLIRLGMVERHAGRLDDALARFTEASEIAELSGALITGRFHHELATTLKKLPVTDDRSDYFDRVINHFNLAFYQFEAIGNHRYAAIVKNNHGYLLLSIKRFEEAEDHLLWARKLFDGLDDKIRRAQVDETLARLHLATEQFEYAEHTVDLAIRTLETGDEEALLAEALTTKGIILCRQGRHGEAKGILEGAHRVAERCGDSEGAGRALLVMIEEMCELLGDQERQELGTRLNKLLANSQQATTLSRLRRCTEVIEAWPRSSGMR